MRLHGVCLSLIVITLVIAGCGENGSTSSANAVENVAFDLDDTLVFSTPSFKEAFKKNIKPFSSLFWAHVNKSDADHSCVKPRVGEILKKHQRKNRSVYIITARKDINAQPVRSFIHNRFRIPRDHLYFEPNGKVDRLKKLEIDIYYGDSDSDIKAAQEAGVKAIRIQRSPKSSYEKKYNPGKFGEKIITNTKNHNCKIKPAV